jgi:DDE superfamily endonuclease
VAHIMLSGLLAAWVGILAEHLHGRNAWRLHRLVVGVILAQGRRTVTSWFRAAGITRGYRSYYYFLAALGLKIQAVGLSLFELSIQRVPIGERLTLALDDTPTKRHGPKIEAAGRHHNPTPGPSGSKTLYGHNWVVLARLVKHARSSIIGLPLWATLYVRQCDVPSLPRGVTPWEFQTKLELAATMIEATADSLKGRWDGPVWLLTDGGYAKRPVYAATRKAGWVMVTRLRRDAHLNDLPPVLKPGQKRGRGRPRIYGTKRIKLSLRAGQKRGWETIEVVMSQGKVKRWEVKTFLATWRVAGGVVRVVIVREESDRSSWRAYVCSDPEATVQEIAQGVADRWGIEQVFHDVKENERIGQVQLRKVWANVGAFNLGLWVNSLVELWAWKRGKASLVDRSESPWDDGERRASHGDRRKALQQELLDSEFQRCGICGHGSRKIRKLFQAVVKLVA